MLRIPLAFFFAAALLGLCMFEDASADAYGDARSELIAAYQARDFAAMREAAAKALAVRPGYPGALFNRALAEVLDGDADSALQTLNKLARADIDFGIIGLPEFKPLESLAGWKDYAARIERLNEPYGTASIAYDYDVGDFVPEGIALGDRGELYLGSIRHGTILRIDNDTVVPVQPDGSWSVFGMRLDGRGGLWFASASVPEYAGNDPDAGRTGLFRLDLSSAAVEVRGLLPAADQPGVLGDLVLADEDTIYASESLGSALYRYSISKGQFTEVIGPGRLRSMQGLVLDASGRYLFVADYVGGLFRLTLADGTLERVSAGESLSLFGIDGLYRYGDELIAIQNGIRPHRVVGITLADDGLTVARHRTLARNLPEFDEPTLGQVVGHELYFVANSHWNRFDREGNLPEDLTGPIVLKLSLRR